MVDVIVCTRTTARCDVCGGKAPHVCQYALRGRLAGHTCGKKLCERCARLSGKDKVTILCPGHKDMEQRDATPAFDPTQPRSTIRPPPPPAKKKAGKGKKK